MIDVSILIVCYQSRDLILQCLEGVDRFTTGCNYEVLLVDCSNDGTVDLVKTHYPKTRIIENSENLGFGRGNNFLAEHANGQFLLLLNPDVIVTDNAIGELYRTAVAMPDAGAIGGLTRLPDGSRDPGCKQFAPTLFRFAVCAVGGGRFLHGGLPENAKAPAEVDMLCGAFMIVRRDVWQKVHGFDSSFFLYSEEVDLCRRIREAGWPIVMTPRAEVIHLAGSGDRLNPRRILLLTTGKMHFFRKFSNRFQVTIGGIILWIHAFLRVIVATLAAPWIGRDRAQSLKNAYRPIVYHPRAWWYGFNNNQSAQT